ncbi:MAG: hypothetical protein A2X86_18775 [Bdellovibrionales bacterium GWA2_49_15]|nr:MAG: hypothetical protein A2X86_18775 [Bdellovibrionales bacterium GWA2_49_15]
MNFRVWVLVSSFCISISSAFGMNKVQLVDAIAKDAKLTKENAQKALDAFVSSTSKSLKKGDRVALVGFGSFSVSKVTVRGWDPVKKASLSDFTNSVSDVVFDVDKKMAQELYPLYALNYFTSLNFINSNVIAPLAIAKKNKIDVIKGTANLRFSSQSFFADAFFDIFAELDTRTLIEGDKEKIFDLADALNESLQKTVIVYAESVAHELTHVVQQSSGMVMKSAVIALADGAIEMQSKYLDPKSDNNGLSDNQLKTMMKDSGLDREVLLKALFFMGYHITETIKNGDSVDLEEFGSFAVSTEAAKLIVPVAINKGLRSMRVTNFTASGRLLESIQDENKGFSSIIR